jgi:hypothetical protein
MNIIRFPAVQTDEKAAAPDHRKEISPLLVQYRDGTRGEFLVWAICAVCAVASIVLCVSQLQTDVNRVRRVHVERISAGQLADHNPCMTDLPKEL